MAGRIYEGHTPRNVSKDAKYSVVGQPPQARLIYRSESGEEALLLTHKHPHLIELVAAARNTSPQGVFYINEYSQILIPTDRGYICAGKYDQLLEFDYRANVISPRPPASLKAGQLWAGPHVGIPYILSVVRHGRHDVYYWQQWTEDGVIHRKKVWLSQFSPSAADLADELARVKGAGGGRIYVNEARVFFAPVDEGAQVWKYRYLGALGDRGWFPEPAC